MAGVCRSSQQAASVLAARRQRWTDVRAIDGKEPLHAVAASSQTEIARRKITALGQTPTKRIGIEDVRLRCDLRSFLHGYSA